MLIRVRSNVGTWRVNLQDGNETLTALLNDNAFTTWELVKDLSLDPSMTNTLSNTQTLSEQGLKHGSMIYCEVKERNVVLKERDAASNNNKINFVDLTSSSPSKLVTSVTEKLEVVMDKKDGISFSEFIEAAKKNKKRKLASGHAPSLSVGLGGRITWDGSDGVCLDEWLNLVHPSKVSITDCHWIDVHNVVKTSPGYDHDVITNFDREAYLSVLQSWSKEIAGRRVKKYEKQDCVNSLLAIAVSQGYTVGKWMLFVNPSNVDEVWEKIARATANGQLGCSAKIAPSLGQERVCLCCVYVSDFSDQTQVKRVLIALKDDLGFHIKCGFKPDIFTELGIETNNKWKLEPTIYKVKEVLEEWK
mmetsp:Transcript_18526/g.21384  ORF Transcript_18526/g.21384 Transcript_18526/m.21384 type:complete len:361 (+) Transcript_18526:201-1283(+)